MEPVWETRVSTRLGTFTVRSSERGIREISFGAGRTIQKAAMGARGTRHSKGEGSVNGLRPPAQSRKWLRRAALELKQYAAGERKRFTFPLDLAGTAFQKKVWKALRSIPYGQTRSYGEIARRVGNPRAARAVGMANHENPLCIVVPCHRVIAGDGSLGGYAAGLGKKSAILRLERDSL